MKFDCETFTGADDSFINFIAPSNEFTIDSNQPDARIFVKYWGYPNPTVVWRDTHGNKVPGSATQNDGQPRKFETLFDADENLTILRILQPTVKDSGNYTLCANNSRIERNQTFQLLVKGMLYANIRSLKRIVCFFLNKLY